MAVPLPSDEADEEPSLRTYHRRRAARRASFAAAAFLIGCVAFLRWKPFRVEVRGPSMRPALEPGDWAIAVARARVGRGDVVVVEHPDRPGYEMVKRIVAIPGDLAPDGAIVDADAFWVQGDATGESTDSRRFGPVPRWGVKGRVRLVYWPPHRRRFL